MSKKPVMLPKSIAEAIILPESFSDLEGVVLPALKWMRTNAPIARAEVDGYDPVWIVASHSLNQEVLRDAELFHNADLNIMFQPRAGDEFLRGVLGGHTRVMPNNLSYLEPPQHTLFREATAHAFLPAQIRKYEDEFRRIAVECIEAMFAEYADECDIVEGLTKMYPLAVIMELLGIPESDWDLMMNLTQETHGGDDPEWRREGVPDSDEAWARGWLESTQEFRNYFRDVVRDRHKNPKDDLSTAIATSRLPNGEYLPEEAQIELTMSIALAGHDTVNSSISAGIHGLAKFPNQLQEYRKNPKLLPGLVEESIRWATPAKHFMRNATRDTVLDGVEIRAGERVMCSFQSANWDESVFEEPEIFDISRRPNPQISFSFGPHVCLGQHIAKLEMRVFFEELLARVETLDLAGEPTLKISNHVSGFKTLPVRYTRRFG